ncbi:MAG: hypothetical protein HYY84_14200 [Deltaproteobacteria bacterium]|nr:hypothetical protein [Deltaproteobacteria bacterium]
MRAWLVVFFLSGVFGLLGDQFFHVRMGVLSYPSPDFLGQSWWVFPLMASSGVAAVLGALMLRRSIALRAVDAARPSIARLALEVGFAFAAYGVTGLLPREHLLLTALLVGTFALRFAFAPSPVALAAALAMAVAGPLVEAGVIALGGFAYGAGIPWEAVPLGFPYWLIALYLHMGLTAAAIARAVDDATRAIAARVTTPAKENVTA